MLGLLGLLFLTAEALLSALSRAAKWQRAAQLLGKAPGKKAEGSSVDGTNNGKILNPKP